MCSQINFSCVRAQGLKGNKVEREREKIVLIELKKVRERHSTCNEWEKF